MANASSVEQVAPARKAVIVAAGKSSRLYPRTLQLPKALLEVNGETLIERAVGQLEHLGISEIAVVTGFKASKIREVLGARVSYIFNPFYAHCNNMGSLWCAREFVGNDPFIYSHADIIYHPDILQSAAAEFATSDFDLSLVTDFCQTDEEMMKVAVTSDNFLLESHKAIAPHEAAGEWTGIAFVRSSDRLFGAMEKILAEEGLDYYDTRAFSLLARDGEKVFCSSTKDLPWTEIDFEADYKRACELFEES